MQRSLSLPEQVIISCSHAAVLGRVWEKLFAASQSHTHGMVRHGSACAMMLGDAQALPQAVL